MRSPYINCQRADPVVLAHQLIAAARSGEQVEVCIDRVRRTEARIHDAAVESYTDAETFGVGVRVVVDGREGTASCGSFDADMVENLLSDARDNAAFASVDERAGLADPDGYQPTRSAHSPDDVDSLSPDQKIALALEVEQSARASDSRVRGVRAAIYGDHKVERAVVSTTGIESLTSSARAAISTSVLIDDVGGGTRTGFASAAEFVPSDLDPEAVGRLAVERGLRLVGASKAKSGRLPVVMQPRFAAAILGVVASMLSGERVFKGRSPFGDRVGSPVAAESLTIYDDPTDQLSMSSNAFDGEGLACRHVSLLTDGILEGFLHDSRSARGLEAAGTASAVRSARTSPSPGFRSLHAVAGEGDVDSMISSLRDGLLILSLQGLNSGVNPVSGDFSVGVEGLRIRNGNLAEPVKEATLAGSLPRMLLDISGVGADIEYLPGGSAVPSMIIDGMSIGGA